MMTFRLAVPIALASIGVSISERSGVVNLGIEGIMLLGALGESWVLMPLEAHGWEFWSRL